MSNIHKFTGIPNQNLFRWEGVIAQPSPNPEVANFVKHVLIGPDNDAPTFIIRYFQLPVGAGSPLHTHAHEHGVIILHGQVRLQLGDAFFPLSPYDVVFVKGGDLHQFTNVGDEPLGFLCTIPRSAEI